MKFKLSQILLGDKNATYICSKIISTLNKNDDEEQFSFKFSL